MDQVKLDDDWILMGDHDGLGAADPNPMTTGFPAKEVVGPGRHK